MSAHGRPEWCECGPVAGPRTEAGRQLLDGFAPMPLPEAPELHRRSAMGRRTKLEAAILAIEAEAADELARETDAAMNHGIGYGEALRDARERIDVMRREGMTINAALVVIDSLMGPENRPLTFASDGTLEESTDG